MLKKGNENNYLSWYNIFCEFILCVVWVYTLALRHSFIYIKRAAHLSERSRRGKSADSVKTSLHFYFQLIEQLIWSFFSPL